MVNKTNVVAWIVSILVAFVLLALPIQSKITAGDITGGKKAPHINVAIFHKLHGHDDFIYPKHIVGEDILHSLRGNAQFILLNHTSGLKNGDVITFGNDVLREGDEDFEDFGVDCQLSLNMKQQGVMLAGMCEILLVDQDNRTIEHKGIVKPILVTVGGGWQLIYLDEEDGIAIYADEEVGLE